MKKLSAEQISKWSSEYIAGGVRDTWRIDSIEADSNSLQANISMESYHTSATDKGGFHLTAFSALEIFSQLSIIQIHNWAKLSEKKQEVWLIESNILSSKTIRDPKHIQIQLNIKTVRKLGSRIYFETELIAKDKWDGHFDGLLKFFLS